MLYALVIIVCALSIASSAAPASRSDVSGRIAYSDRFWPKNLKVSDNWEIFVLDGAGGAKRNLSRSPHCDETDPAWSPDGTSVAFLCSWGKPVMYVMRDDGRLRRPIAKTITASHPSWSPDGRKIAFLGDGWISIIGVDGRGLRRVTRASGSGLSWSPDGQKIAFVRGAGIFVVNVDGHGLRQLTRRRRDRLPAWSPDGRNIAFARSNGIYVVDPDGSDVHRLLSGGSWPAWSPDSRQLAFLGVTPPSYPINVVNRDGSHRQTVGSAGQPAGLSWGKTP
jgi:Tol biopolymer transport system component